MAELKRKEGELTTAELAGYGVPPKQPEGPKLVKAPEQETLGQAPAVSEPVPLFSESEMGDFRSQWSKVQTGFVDEPRRTVQDADKLVAAVMQRLAEGFANERKLLFDCTRHQVAAGVPPCVLCKSRNGGSNTGL